MIRKSLSRLIQFGRFSSFTKSDLGNSSSLLHAELQERGKANRRISRNRGSQSGVTLIETIVASLILLIVVVGLLPILTMGFQTTEQQGDTATRTTEYSNDKMEALFNLNFNDGTTDTTIIPANPVGGTGLGGAMAPSSTVGAVAPAASVAGYVDYVDLNGNLLPSAAGAVYVRQWSITTDATATMKTIGVSVTAVQGAGVLGLSPSTRLVCVKSSGL
jgi:hypothetical protein